MNGRERVLAFLDGRPVDRLCVAPITMMFAAQHAGVTYRRYTLEPDVLAEAQIRTAEDFGFDHVSAITETREAPDCGAPVRYFDNQPYALDETCSVLSDKSLLARLTFPDPLGGGRMHERVRAIARMKERTTGAMLVEGWVEGPCGASADLRGINRLMLDFYDDPAFVRGLLDFCLELALRFGRAQAEAGADAIGVGDPAASLVGPAVYREFILDYQRRLVEGLHGFGLRVRLHVCGNTRRVLSDFATLGCDIIDIDSAVPIAVARKILGPGPCLLGGIDPVRALQDGTPETVWQALAQCRADAGERYIVGAGCEIPPGTPPGNVKAMAEFARAGG